MSRLRVALVGFLLLGALALLLVPAIRLAEGIESSAPPVFVKPVIPAGLALRLSAHAIEAKIFRSLGPTTTISSIRVLPDRRGLGRALPGTGSFAGPDAAGGPVWVIRFRANINVVSPGLGKPHDVAFRHGYTVIDDASGHEIEYGYGN